MDWLKTDDLSVILGICFVAVYAASKFLKPQSLVHPLLLGRQADVGRVRMPGESAIYRNYATGITGRLPERPKPEVKLVSDLVPDEQTAERMLWSTRIINSELKARSGALAAALTQMAGLVPGESTAFLLLDDCLEFIITDLALAQISLVSFTLSTLSLLAPALQKHNPTTIFVHESFLEQIIEHLTDLRQNSHRSIIVIGDDKGSSVLHSQKSGIRVLRWEDLEAKGQSLSKPDVPAPSHHDVFTVALFNDRGELRGAEIKHINLTAGVMAARLFFPLGDPISALDTMLSVFPLRTPFGRTLAYTALFQGANYISPPASLSSGTEINTSVDLLEFCEGSAVSPTILFLTPSYVRPLTGIILTTAKANPFFWFGWRHKLRALHEGFLTKTSFWDNVVWEPARKKVLDRLEVSLRGIVVSQGQLEAAQLENARVAFSVPIVLTYSHPLICGPILASHPLDLQSFPVSMASGAFNAHIGPPAPNVEVKLSGVDDDAVDAGKDPEGELSVRGPPVAKPLPDENPQAEGWVSTGQKARVHPNGTFKLF